MSKGKNSKRSTSKPPAAAEEPAELQAEVKAFASELGLAGVDGVDHAFDDFAPKKARETLGKAGKRKSRQEQEVAGNAAAGSADPKKRPRSETGIAERGRREEANQQNHVPPPVSESMAKAIKERTWNAGVGPRPGDGRRSLLDRDGAAVWYEAAAALPSLPANGSQRPSEEQVAELLAKGEKLLDREAEVFESELGRKNGQDARWLQQVRRSGTTSDKVAAVTLLLQESAVANVKSLETLVGWVAKRKGGRNVVGQAVDAGREIFLTALLPDRKLRWLSQQPLAAMPPGREGDRHLLYWTLEHQLKQQYAAFVAALEEGSRDNLEWVKEKSLAAAAELLRCKPEAEAALLTLLVNKLGDPSRKLASKAGYLLSGLLGEHPGMKPVVIAEVQRFIFRPGLQERARYYAVVFLNQLQLSHNPAHGGSELAKKLIDLYLTLFQLIMSGKVGHAATAHHEAQQRAEVACLARRAAGGKGRGSSRNKAAPKPLDPKAAVGDRSVEEVDARMLGALVTGVRRAFPYVDAAEVEDVIEKHSEVLFRVTHTAPLGVSLQVLALLLQIMAGRRAVSDRFYRALYALMLSPEVGRTSKASMFASVVFKAMKADVSSKRVAAFAKRLLQVALQSPAPFAAGSLFLISEVLKSKSALWTAIQQPEETADEVERFADAPEPTGHTDGSTPQAAAASSPASEAAAAEDADSDDEAIAATEGGSGAGADGADSAAQQHQQGAASGGQAGPGPQPDSEPPWPTAGSYDMRKREPLYSGAEGACWWEVAALAAHVHPSVTAMAATLLSGSSIVYDGDPLRDLALPAFLDKFLRRKPKSKVRGQSVMQPLPKTTQQGGQALAALAAADVLPDFMFLHKFYSSREASRPAKKARREAADADSDASEAEIDELLNEEEEAGVAGEGAMAEPDGYDYSELAHAFDASDPEASDSDVSDEDEASRSSGETDVMELNPHELAEATSSDAEDAGDDSGSDLDLDSLDVDDIGSGGGGGFASADDWQQRIDDFEAAQTGRADDGASDEAGSDDSAEAPAKPSRKPGPTTKSKLSAIGGIRKLEGRQKERR